MDGLSIQRRLPTMPESESIDEPASQRQHNEDRMRRAYAWIKRSKQDDTEEIERFMFLWVAFNAAYGNEAALRDFVDGKEGRKGERIPLLHGISREYCGTGCIRRLGKNRLGRVLRPDPGPAEQPLRVPPFWKSVWDPKLERDWERHFKSEKNRVRKALSTRDVLPILSVVFRRLYTLRNQIFHGGATYPSGFGHTQIRDGSRIMASLVPAIIDIMKQDLSRDSDSETWGKVAYPRINAEPE